MSRRWYTSEQIIHKLREAEVLFAESMTAVGAAPQYHRADVLSVVQRVGAGQLNITFQ